MSGLDETTPCGEDDGDCILNTTPGKHTDLSLRSFAAFSAVAFGVGLLGVGFGVVGVAMVAPFGLEAVAAVGLGESVIMLLSAFFVGFINVFTARLARAEGSGKGESAFPKLLHAFLIAIVFMEILATIVAVALWFVLPLMVADSEVAKLARQYVAVRLLGVALFAALVGVREALKIIGARNTSVVVYAIGLGLFVALNMLFLRAIPGTLAGSPTVSIAASALVAQAVMIALGIRILRHNLRDREFEKPPAGSVLAELRTMLPRGAGIGVRHLNDWAGGTVPTIMAASLGTKWLAAITVASQIWTLFCRVPQASFSAGFVFYGYAVERRSSEAQDVRQRVTRYSAVPMVVDTALFLIASPLLIRFLSGGKLDLATGMTMVAAFFILVVPYFFEGLNGELLSVLEDGGFMSWTSTLATWLGNIGLAAFGVYVLKSAFWAYSLAVIPTIVLATAFTMRLNYLTVQEGAGVDE